jgi:hypothetical protein
MYDFPTWRKLGIGRAEQGSAKRVTKAEINKAFNGINLLFIVVYSTSVSVSAATKG